MKKGLLISFFNRNFLFKETFFLRKFGFFKVPLLFLLSPTVIKSDQESCIIKISLRKRTRNHLHSMYFGALCIGADCAGGFTAMKLIHDEKLAISLVFKEFHANFIKRAESDVYFINNQTKQIRSFIFEASYATKRMQMPLKIIATNHTLNENDPIAVFTLCLSVKKIESANKKPIQEQSIDHPHELDGDGK